MSYIDYVMSLRIGEAERLLAHTNMPVKDIAACVGYEYANSFYKVFKKKVGMAPLEFREKSRSGQ